MIFHHDFGVFLFLLDFFHFSVTIIFIVETIISNVPTVDFGRVVPSSEIEKSVNYSIVHFHLCLIATDLFYVIHLENPSISIDLRF